MPENITLRRRRYGGASCTHSHDDHHQIVLPLRGTLAMEIGGLGGKVTAAHAAFIPAGERHAFQALDPVANAFLVLDIEGAALASINGDALTLSEELARRPFFPITAGIRHLLAYADDLLPSTSVDPDHAPSNERALLASWTMLLFRAVEREWLNRNTTDRSAEALARAVAFIVSRFDEPTTVSDIARAAGFSESRLHALFRERLGQTPRDHLARVRLVHALDLLADPRLSIAEIAVRSGYADQSTLTRRMRAVLDVTPAAYRRSLAGCDPSRVDRCGTSLRKDFGSQ